MTGQLGEPLLEKVPVKKSGHWVEDAVILIFIGQ